MLERRIDDRFGDSVVTKVDETRALKAVEDGLCSAVAQVCVVGMESGEVD